MYGYNYIYIFIYVCMFLAESGHIKTALPRRGSAESRAESARPKIGTG